MRANAVCLLSDAFPVLHASMDREERDTALQRQFDLFKVPQHLHCVCKEPVGICSLALSSLCRQDLLEDPSVTVRCAATAGVCRILGSYWELVPPPVIRSLLKRLLGDLARDAASVSVRVAVVQVGHVTCMRLRFVCYASNGCLLRASVLYWRTG